MLLDVLFPKFCICCKKIGAYICVSCKNKIELSSNNICRVCSRPTNLGINHPWCKDYLDGVFSIFTYKTPVKEVVKNIKYNLTFSVWKEILEVIENNHLNQLNEFKNKVGVFYIQSIPLHPQRLKQRGFNQNEIFTSFLSRTLQNPQIDLLERKINTISQVEVKDKSKRLENIKNAFSLKKNPSIDQTTIILVDDVFTTGSTCREAAKILKEKGVLSVYAITLARD